MCGYARRHIRHADLEEFVSLLGLMGAYGARQPSEELLHFRPAFGGAAYQQIKDLIIREDGQLKTVDATWWYECKEDDNQLIVDNKLTTFNARNLTSRYWKSGIRHHRAIVLATAIGEGKEVEKKKHSYFVESDTPLLIGAVYRKFENNLYSTAIITRDEHPRFSEYHDKAFPLFLPPDPEFLQLWLANEPRQLGQGQLGCVFAG